MDISALEIEPHTLSKELCDVLLQMEILLESNLVALK